MKHNIPLMLPHVIPIYKMQSPHIIPTESLRNPHVTIYQNGGVLVDWKRSNLWKVMDLACYRYHHSACLEIEACHGPFADGFKGLGLQGSGCRV